MLELNFLFFYERLLVIVYRKEIFVWYEYIFWLFWENDENILIIFDVINIFLDYKSVNCNNKFIIG